MALSNDIKIIPLIKTPLAMTSYPPLAEDKNGIIWIGTSNGLNSFDITNGKFICLPSQSQPIQQT